MKKRKGTSTISEKKVLLTQSSPFAVKEAYKMLRTNVSFSFPGSECKCIGITSAERGDGKSSIAMNLAISYAQINKKVLLIDCDMRLPTVAKRLGLRPAPGLSNYLAGTENDDTVFIRKDTPLGIDVITAGEIPPDPTTLLESEQMGELINQLKSQYDYIIFDFPPITLVTDAAILSKNIDGYLLIVKHGKSEFSKISETLKQLEFSDAKIIGFVYNGKSEHNYKYKFGKRYYYKNDYYGK